MCSGRLKSAFYRFFIGKMKCMYMLRNRGGDGFIDDLVHCGKAMESKCQSSF